MSVASMSPNTTFIQLFQLDDLLFISQLIFFISLTIHLLNFFNPSDEDLKKLI